MRALLLRCYPARWRARYGDEFEALLGERPLGPFDVADVLLGALDAHLHLRGLGAASEHGKGFPMSQRLGGYAAIVGGVLWFLILVGNAINDGRESGSTLLGYLAVAVMVAMLVALVGLSAFQARRHPALTWAAFAIPFIGTVLALAGFVAIVATGSSDGELVAGLSPWMLGTLGFLTMILGSFLFAIATWRTRALSRSGSVLVAVGSVLVVLAISGLSGIDSGSALSLAALLLGVVAFPAGWVLLGVSALRATGPVPLTLEGASL